MLTKLSRSALLTEQDCARKFYWKYLFESTGLEEKGSDVTPAIGVATHKGLESHLNGASEDEAVALALAKFAELTPHQLEWEFDFIGYTLKECSFLVECLVRIGVRLAIPEIKERWTVVEAVERKLLVPIPDTSVQWTSIADGELAREEGGTMSALSWKTTEKWLDRKLEVPLIDMQGVSEPWAIEQATGRPCKSVVMCWFLTGATNEERGLGRRTKDSPLVRPWFSGKEWAWRYEWPDGDRKKRVGKEFKRMSVWEYMTAVEWLSLLESGEVLGGPGALRSQFVGPLEYFREPWKTERWLRQLQGKVGELYDASVRLDMVRAEGGNVEEWVDRLFPQTTRGCPWCPYYKLCWNSVKDPLGEGGFVRRER